MVEETGAKGSRNKQLKIIVVNNLNFNSREYFLLSYDKFHEIKVRTSFGTNRSSTMLY